MKKIFNILFLVATIVAYAQPEPPREYIIKVTYEKQMWSNNIGSHETYLYANDNKSQFVYKSKYEKIPTPEGFDLTRPYLEYTNNYNFQNQEVEENRTLEDGTILYASWKNDTDWKITDEEKMIGEYKAKKAIAKYTQIDPENESYIEQDVIAWFTTEIPIPSGPGRYYGLPGLILEIELSRYTQDKFKFKSLEVIPAENYTFVELNKKNTVREKEDVIYFEHKNPKEIRKFKKNK